MASYSLAAASTAVDASIIPGANYWAALVTAYAAIALLGGVGMLGVFGTCVATARLRRNPVLLNFHLLFIVTAAGETFLIWTGYAIKTAPPYGLCAVSATFIASAATGKAAAAFALTCQVWAHVLMLNKPRSPALRALASPRLLIPLSWTAFLLILFSAAGLAAAHPDSISRSSVYYCQMNMGSIIIANYAVAAVFEVTTLILAVWVGACVLRVRQRALGVTSTRSQPVHRALAIRTVVFGIVLFIAILLELVCLLVKITVPIPGLILATINLLAFIVFASDPILIRSFLRRVRREDDSVSRSGYPSPGPHSRVAVSVHVTTTGPMRDEDDEEWKGAHALHTLPHKGVLQHESLPEVDAKTALPMPADGLSA